LVELVEVADVPRLAELVEVADVPRLAEPALWLSAVL
jgi:hypothetical protein